MDVELVRRAQGGDDAAFAGIAASCEAHLHAVAIRILRDPDLAADATQQALVSIWRDLPSLREPERFDAWAHRVLVRVCYLEAGRRRRLGPTRSWESVDAPSCGDSTKQIADRDQLMRGLLRLPKQQRAVVVLHHYCDLPLAEVARTLDVPIGTVRSRLFYAMRALRAALEADARPAGRCTPAAQPIVSHPPSIGALG
ncbi:MAG: RNA polymerase sigma factor [Chloroflexota bacterium]|nr:RNA polymerase sigma factor [Chloroflexota bacterium]